MSIKIFIFDNKQKDIAHLRGLLKALGYQDDDIWPEGYRAVKKWPDVWGNFFGEMANGRARENDCCMLFLDLALGEKTDDIKAGVKEIKEGRNNALLENCVWVIYSDNSHQSELEGKVDALIDKSSLYQNESKVATAMLRLKIDEALDAWRKRTKRPAPTTPLASRVTVDLSTAAGRLLMSNLGLSQIEHLAPHEWPTVHVEALSGGYSGAYVVRFREKGGGSRELVAKLSTNRQSLETEAAKWRDAVASTAFNGILNNALPPEKIGDVSKLVLASVPGPTLEEMAKSTSPGPGEALAPLFELAIDAARRCCKRQRCELMKLEPRNVEAFNANLQSLIVLRDACARRSQLPPDFPLSEKIQKFSDDVVNKWDSRLEELGLTEPMTVPQHGDLNPRNIIMPLSGPIQLIDFARFGEWPAGYDLARLELQMLLRLLGTGNGDEFFPDQLAAWTTLWNNVEAGKPAASEPDMSPKLLEVLKAIAKAREELYAALPMGGPDASSATAVMRCSDSMKMACYQDATPFKKLLFLYIAIRAAIAARLM